jgi:hypothetical protein
VIPYLAGRFHRVRIVHDQDQRFGLIGDTGNLERRGDIVACIAITGRDAIPVVECRARKFHL